MRWTTTVNEWDRLKGATANLYVRTRLHQPQRWDPMPWCGSPIKGVLPAAHQLNTGLRPGTDLHHRVLCIGVGAQLVNASSVIHVNVCDQRAIKAL